MLTINKYEGKTEEEALSKAMVELNCEKENLIYNTEFVEGKLFKSAKYIINVVEISKIKEYLNEFFKEFAKNMNIESETEILYINDGFNVTLLTSNNALLIGKEGKNLTALQTIIRQNLKVLTDMSIKVNIDIGNYKTKKLKNLEREVKKLAREVMKTKVDVSLDPMNSYERRYIHNIVDSYKNVTTESEGEGKDRHIVIKYVEEK